MSTSNEITQVIHRGGCTINIVGQRSRKGWDVKRKDGDTIKSQGHRKLKDEAIQLAEDACEPGVATTFFVCPALEARPPHPGGDSTHPEITP